jgi:HAD superfamily hydrolase (TIGR01450 family)
VADLLVSLGIEAKPDEVVTAAHVSADLMAKRLPAGAKVYVVGGSALVAEVSAVGLVPVDSADARPDAVVQGYAPEVGWKQLAEACVAVRGGAWWVATNPDRTLPSTRGELPGNGSLVAALATALDRQPDVIVGKPAPTLFTAAAANAGASRPLVVGDRLDTDIEGAARAGMDSLLVLTGVSTPADVLAAPEGTRPTWIAPDLRALADESAAARVPVVESETAAATSGWRATRTEAGLELDGAGSTVAALAALAATAWAGADLRKISSASSAAAKAIEALGLS